jgi:hypothetical protein
VNDLATVGVRSDVRKDVAVRGRLQYDRTFNTASIVREYVSIGAAGEYRLLPYLTADVGVTYRSGHMQNGTGGDFDDVIVHVGIAGSK